MSGCFLKHGVEPNATLETCSRSSNTEIAMTPQRIVRLSFKCGTQFHHVTDVTLQMFKVKDQRSRSQGQRSISRRKVMYQQQKRYNVAMDRFSDVKLVMAS